MLNSGVIIVPGLVSSFPLPRPYCQMLCFLFCLEFSYLPEPIPSTLSNLKKFSGRDRVGKGGPLGQQRVALYGKTSIKKAPKISSGVKVTGVSFYYKIFKV